MSISDLLSIVKPPEHPKYRGSEEAWRLAEAELNIRLPADYKELIHYYGTGSFVNEHDVFNYADPRGDAPGETAVIPFVRDHLQAMRDLLEWDEDDEFPYALHPDTPGLLPCGMNGEFLINWLTAGVADDWTIVVTYVGGELDWQAFACDLTTFLAKLLKRELDCWITPGDEVSDDEIRQFRN